MELDRDPGEAYSDATRLTALAIYAECGSVTAVERLTGIPKTTVHVWVNSDDGMATVDQLRTAIRSQVAHKFAAIASKAADEALDRLIHGDAYVDTVSGAVKRKPVALKDAIAAAGVATDKHALLTGAMQGDAQVNKALRTLADKLVDAVAAKLPSASARPNAPLPAAGMPELG